MAFNWPTRYFCLACMLAATLGATACSDSEQSQPAENESADSNPAGDHVQSKSIFSELEKSARSGAFEAEEEEPAQTNNSRPAPTRSGGTDGLTRKQIESLIEDLDSSLSNDDIESAMAHFAPSFKATIKSGGKSGGSKTLTRSEFRDQVSKILKQARNYTNRRSDVSISVAQDGRSATYQSDQNEIIKIGKRTIQDTTRQTIQIELVDNEPMIVALKSRPDA